MKKRHAVRLTDEDTALAEWVKQQIHHTQQAALDAREAFENLDDEWEEWKISDHIGEWENRYPATWLDKHWQLHSPGAVLDQCDAQAKLLIYAYKSSQPKLVRLLADAYQYRPGYPEPQKAQS